MVDNLDSIQQYEDPENFDEEWWSAVLNHERELVEEDHLHDDDEHGLIPSQKMDWTSVEHAHRKDVILLVTVHAANRGGLLVKGDGIQGFIPLSHLVDIPVDIPVDEFRGELKQYIGRQIRAKIIESDPIQRRVVLSERAACAGEGKRKELFHSIRVGMKMIGVVTNITEFGAFIDLGGLEGLVHVSEISWGRVHHPAEVLKVGTSVHVIVLQMNLENGRIALSLKRLQPNPWESLTRRYKPGDIVPAIITTLTNFGAFARLEDGVEGLIHISSMPHLESADQLGSILHTGDRVHVRILHMDINRRRLGLALVQIE